MSTIEPWQESLLRQLFEPDEITAALARDPEALHKLWDALGEQLREALRFEHVPRSE